MVATSK